MEEGRNHMTNQKLSPAKFTLLGFQHMFAMFGATVLVPTLTGLSVSATLLFAGLGTLLFHLITGGKVPAFLGSSFAFLGGYAAVKAMPQFADGTMNWIPYAGVGVAVAGLIYVVVGSVQDLRRAEGHALLPADCHRPYHHLHRHDSGELRHQQLLQ